MKKFLSKIKLANKGFTIIAAFSAIIASGLICGFNSGENAFDIRREADMNLRILEAHEQAAHIENSGNGTRIWGLRADADQTLLNPAIILAAQFVTDVPDIVERETAQTSRPSFPAQTDSPVFAPLLMQDGASTPRLVAALPQDFGDPLDEWGYPVRWRIPGGVLSAYSPLKPAPEAPRLAAPELVKPRPPASPREYRYLVENFARKFNLNVALVMAIIHSESNFSPNLVSSKSAMGLMQLLPSTASDEVHRFLYGQAGRVSYAELKIPETNIRYGTAYLHILLNRYFSGVKNREVRESCAIASYNMGPNRFLKLYGSTPEKAVTYINSMSPEEFNQDLHNRLPVRETRFYVNKVRKMKAVYAGAN